MYCNYFFIPEIPFNTTQLSTDDPYGVVCPNNMKHLNVTPANMDIGSGTWGGKFWDLYSSVPFYVAIIIFPLLNFNTTSFFTKFNSLGNNWNHGNCKKNIFFYNKHIFAGTLSVLYLMIFVIIKGAGWGLHIDSWVAEITIKTDFSVLSGMLALSFFIHNIIITVMRNNKHQENNVRFKK